MYLFLHKLNGGGQENRSPHPSIASPLRLIQATPVEEVSLICRTYIQPEGQVQGEIEMTETAPGIYNAQFAGQQAGWAWWKVTINTNDVDPVNPGVNPSPLRHFWGLSDYFAWEVDDQR